jgi:WD40 repeat protein
MLCQGILRQTIFATVFLFAASPSWLRAQGSPDIIWKRQVSVDRVNSVIFTPDGNTLISGGSDRLINLWRVSDGTLIQTLNTNAPFVHASAIESLSISPDASQLASCSYKVVQLWSLPSGSQRVLNGHTDWVVGVAFSPDGSLLASASFDTTVRIWRASDGSLVKVLQGSGQQRCVAFSPDGSLIATTSADNSVKLWRTSDWTLVQTLSGHTDDVFTVAFSPDGNTLASGGYDDTVKLWNVADGTLRFTFDGNGGNVYGLAFTPDGSKIAYTDGEGSTIKIYSVADGALLRTFTSEVNEVQTVAFSRDGLMGYGRVDETVVLARINSSSSARISSPAIGTTYNSPANVTIVASPSKSNGIVKMEFFQNGSKLGEDLSPPFTYNWNDVPAGTYALTVVDTDTGGTSTESGPVTITVADNSELPPSISISAPEPGATFSEPADVTITASANASAGVARVEFFQDGISLGQDTSAPFKMVWTSVPIGNYSLTAVVTDNNGATATSEPINISVQEAPPETVRPRVSIVSPAARSRFTTPDITVSGSASDNVAVARVLYSLNSEDFRPADGTDDWQAAMTLSPGSNVVRVKSVDANGNESAIVSRSFSYVVSDAISVTVNGLGTVSIKDGRILKVGKTYTIKARTSADSIFNGWTGTITTNKSRFSFVMEKGMNLTANFVPNPFAERKGTYVGLIQPVSPNNEQTGFIKITTTRKGTFSGKVTLGGKNYSTHGAFDGNGSFTGGHSRSGLSINLLLHLDDDSDQITGSISDDVFTSQLTADRLVHSKTDPASEAGKYTILIPANTNERDAPQGNSFGILKVDASGKTRVAGSLADGTKFSQSAGISKNGTWPFYAPLYKHAGSISGEITFRDQPGVSDLDGTVDWFRPPMANAKIFPDGFSTETALLGSTYVRASGQPVLSVIPGEQNVLINLGEGDLDSELQKAATLENNNKIVVPDSNDEKLSVSVSASSGSLHGSFLHPVTGRKTRHSGVVFQKQNLAEGYFIGPDQSGFVSVVPTESDGGFSTGEPSVAEDIAPVTEPDPTTPTTETVTNPKKRKRH